MSSSEKEYRMSQLVNRQSSSSYHAPSMSSDLSPARCPRCAAPLNKEDAAAGWTIAPFLRDSLALLGTGLGGCVGGFYTFNAVMPPLSKKLKGRGGLQVLLTMPPVLLAAAGSAGLGAGALPAFAQLVTSTYHVTTATTHASVSGVTSRIEDRRDP